jgi:hypothetical protein
MSSRRRRRSPGSGTPSNPAPRRRTAGAEFWGREPAEPPPPEPIRPPDDPTALVRSLGPPPLPGWERVAEHYFAAVYEKSTNLAVALAAASGLLGPADDE